MGEEDPQQADRNGEIQIKGVSSRLVRKTKNILIPETCLLSRLGEDEDRGRCFGRGLDDHGTAYCQCCTVLCEALRQEGSSTAQVRPAQPLAVRTVNTALFAAGGGQGSVLHTLYFHQRTTK